MNNIPEIKIPQGKKIFFASDFHLGIPNHEESLKREKKLIQWLQSIRKEAYAIYLMGDIFDFWFEYKTAVPKGYVRLLGLLAELTDNGIKIFLFRGNHDIWAFDYLKKECGIELHRKPLTIKLNNKIFYLAHGDGLGKGDYGYKFLKFLFEGKISQFLFNWLHPDIGLRIGLFFSRRSRLANQSKAKKTTRKAPSSKSILLQHAHQVMEEFPEINYFIFGHSHVSVRYPVKNDAEMIILGDWITLFTYTVFDGENIA
ncbi:MAG: UDP-2,3-diacylglucosamine hydrolase, partial [Bacteroidetes bacterium]